jgi:tetratricopeptide (TPR) repeat protein
MSRKKKQAAPPSPVYGWDLWHSRYRTWIILTFALVVTAIFSAFLVHPIYTSIKAWRARSLASQAGHLAGTSETGEAFEKLVAAYRLNPHEPTVLRAMALWYEKAGRPEAVLFWEQFMAGGQATPDDRRHYIRSLMAAGRLPQAAEQAEMLLRSNPRDADNLRLASEVMMAGGDFTNALSYAQQAVWARPDDIALQFYLQTFQAYSQIATTRQAAIASIVQLARTDPGELGSDALVFLTKLTLQEAYPKSEADWIPQRLRDHPKSTTSMQLLATQLEIALHPERRNILLDAMVEKGSAAPDADARLMAVWLMQQKDPGRALQVLPLDRALKSREMLLAHLDGLALLGRWNEIQSIMLKKPQVIEPSLQHIFLARCALESKQPDKAAVEWRQAQVAASQDPGQLVYLAEYTDRLRQDDAAVNAYEALSQIAATSRIASVALIKIHERNKQTSALLKTLADMRSKWPEDAAVTNDFAYLSALLNQRTDIALAIAEDLMAKEPSSMPHRTAVALARLRLHKPAEAAKVYEGIKIDWNTLLPRDRAVYAAVLYANGSAVEARLQALQISKAALYPEEVELIQPLLK